MHMVEAVSGAASAWQDATRLAASPAPAEVWRSRLAEALHRAIGDVFATVVTCPPGNWLRIEHDSHPPRFRALVQRIDSEYVPRIDKIGEGWRFALERFGKVYAPLDVALHRPLAERLYREELAPEGVRGYLTVYMLDSQRLLLGFFVIASAARSSDELMARHGAALEALADVAAGTLETAISLARGCGLVMPTLRQATQPLTKREREVARLIADGLSNLTAAARLDVSEATVGVHLKRIFSKLGIHSRQELVAQFGRLGEV